MTSTPTHAFQVHHYPQIPCKPFVVECDTLQEAAKLSDVLAEYDLFQFENKIKPDYANVTAVLRWDEEIDEWEEVDEDELEDMKQ